MKIASILLLVLPLALAPAAEAATLTFPDGNRSVAAQVTGPGGVCDLNTYADPALASTFPLEVQAGCESHYQSGAHTDRLWLGLISAVVEGNSWASWDGAGTTGLDALGSSSAMLHLSLDDTATVRVHVRWSGAGDGGEHSSTIWATLRSCDACPDLLHQPEMPLTASAPTGDETIFLALSPGLYRLDMSTRDEVGTLLGPSGSSGGVRIDLFLVSFETTSVSPLGGPAIAVDLGGAHPNPSRARVALELLLPIDGRVVMDVFDLAGHRVRRAVDAHLPSGRQQLEWDGADTSGQAVRPGVYFARVQVNGTPLVARRILRVE